MMMKQNIALLLATAFCWPAAAGGGQSAASDAAPASHAGAKDAAADAKDAGGSAELPPAISPAAAALRPAPRTLNIFVLAGNGAVNSIRSRSAAIPVIEVRDERNLPLPGVAIVLQLPAFGPGGFFPGQRLTWSGRSDANGQAAATGLVPNQQAGRFGIHVTATYGSSVAHATISQTNSLKSAPREAQAGRRSRWWTILAVTAAGGAAGGIVWATRGGAETSTVVLRPGTISFGGPR